MYFNVWDQYYILYTSVRENPTVDLHEKLKAKVLFKLKWSVG